MNVQALRKRAAPVGGGLALIASLSGNALQYEAQQSEGERCQEIVMHQTESYMALQTQCVQALAECAGP